MHLVTRTKNRCIRDQVHVHLLRTKETQLDLGILRVRQSLNSVQIQQDQLLLIPKNTFLVLVLGFHAIGIDCRDKKFFPDLLRWCSPRLANSLFRFGFSIFGLSRFDSLPPWVISMYQLQCSCLASGLSLAHPGGLTMCRQNFQITHHSTSM